MLEQVKAELKMGFVVNPIAGMGGRVGLKGTNGVLEEALARGAKPIAPNKAKEFLAKLKELQTEESIDILTCPTPMGAEEVKAAELTAQILPMSLKSETTAEDTKLAIQLLVKSNVDLIVFVGGDGTARDLLDSMEEVNNVLVLGVPSGVKMHSGIFATSALDAAEIVIAFLQKATQTVDFEIMDVNEAAFRQDQLSVKLYGFLKGPFVPMRLVGSKQVSPETIDEHENQMATARFIVENMDASATYILGPGTTIKCIADLLGVEKTVLGVDVYRNKTVIKDVNEQKMLQEIKDWQKVWIILSPIGRQGMLLGRGNQQISPKIIKRVGKEKILVAATRSKIQGIEGNTLRVDTGTPEIDNMLRGYIRVVTDYREWRLVRVQ
ncbi:MAG: ATP-NAD kinase family protein [Candidatus Bathyarchaeota archaeon]|nr:ATP-NAD kinase family protein [Candidatus Bathyarchaeota archaeon]